MAFGKSSMTDGQKSAASQLFRELAEVFEVSQEKQTSVDVDEEYSESKDDDLKTFAEKIDDLNLIVDKEESAPEDTSIPSVQRDKIITEALLSISDEQKNEEKKLIRTSYSFDQEIINAIQERTDEVERTLGTEKKETTKEVLSIVNNEEQIQKDKELIKNVAKTVKKELAAKEKQEQQQFKSDEVPFDVVEKDDEEDDGEDIIEAAEHDTLIADNPNNPLNLDDSDLKFYEMLKEKHEFLLYDGNPAMKQFFKFKVRELGYIISRHKLLECNKLLKEIKNIELDHAIKGLPDPETISEKINMVMRERDRLGEILREVHCQNRLWESAAEMLQGKLFHVKDVKGIHKRPGLALEYMSDVVHYATELKIVMDTGKYIDGLLLGAIEGYSRQLSCIQEVNKMRPPERNEQFDKKSNKYDSSVSSPSAKTGSVKRITDSMSNADDDILNIG